MSFGGYSISGGGAALTTKPPKNITLNRGQNLIKVDQKTPLAIMNLKGRTLVNLLGRLGNGESTTGVTTYQSTVTTDTANYVSGTSSLKVAVGTGFTSGSGILGSQTAKAGKYYLVIGKLKNGNATNCNLDWNGGSSAVISDTTKFITVFFKVTKVADTSANYDLNVTGVAGQYAYFDEARLYEVDQITYNKIGDGVTAGYQTADDLDKLFPYVDDVKHITNPYVVKQGRNLLPPFTEWTLNAVDDVTEPYKLTKVATASGQYASVRIPVIAGQTYTISYSCSDNVNAYMNIAWKDITGTSTISYSPVPTNGVSTVTAPSGAVYADVLATQTASGTYTFDKPMLNLGSSALTHEPQNQDVLYVPTSLASSVDGTVYDTLYERDGALRKLKRFVTDFVLDGSLPWAFSTDFTGFKNVNAQLISYKPNLWQTVKYDGKVLPSGVSNVVADQVDFGTDGKVWIAIADTDSGWGETYTPTADEIKAYFYGWKMKTSGQQAGSGSYPGTGAKAWVEIDWAISNPTSTNETLILPTTNAWNKFGYKTTAYKLTYQLATEQEETVLGETGLAMHDGLNQVELGEGLIVREVANPQKHSTTGQWFINESGLSTSVTDNPLRYRVSKILAVYKNGIKDSKWTVGTGTTNLSGAYVYCENPDFDPTAEYTVSYYVLDKYAVSGNVITLDSQYAVNLKGVVDTNTQNIADLKKQADATVITLDMMRTKPSEEPWIVPTLLNGWVNYGGVNATAGYYKDTLGIVHLRGLVKSGTITAGTAICTLPPGFRPSAGINMATASSNGSPLYGMIAVDTSGNVSIQAGQNTYISLDNIHFRAEQ